MKTREPRRTSPAPPTNYSHESISARAKVLWERRGRPDGQDDEIWYEAERHLRDSSLARADDARFANSGALLNGDAEPNDELDERLSEIAAPPGQRSATSL